MIRFQLNRDFSRSISSIKSIIQNSRLNTSPSIPQIGSSSTSELYTANGVTTIVENENEGAGGVVSPAYFPGTVRGYLSAWDDANGLKDECHGNIGGDVHVREGGDAG